MAVLVFRVIDYCVMGGFLLFSLAIGLYYGCWKKQTTPEEYLLGNRQMHLIPVALSLLVTYASAISVMGIPAEVYLYDSMVLHLYIGISVTYLITAFTIVPLVYPLRITSAYEYLGQRFQSRAVQLLGALIGILQTVLYMSIVLYAPALALEAVAGIPLWMSIVVVGIVGTIYTALGGIKSVVWTDVFQCIILYVGIIATLVLGVTKVGGLQKVIDIARQGGRTNISTGSMDLTVRHTLFSCIVGGIFNWIPNCCNQSAIQRISAMKSNRQAQIAMLLNVPLILVYGGVLIFTGMVLYAYFMVRDCDPVTAGYVANGNQVIPYFVIDVMRDVPGLAGVFIAALFSGALSSLSSGINAMAANTVEDILGGLFKEVTQTRITFFAKIIVFVYGIISVGLAYAARNLKGSIVQIALSAMGAAGGPVSGLFFLGGIFPQANWIGAFSGGIISLAITIWIAVGSVLYGNKTPLSPSPSTSGCVVGFTSNVSDNMSNFTTVEQLTTVDSFYTSSITTFLETRSSSAVTTISELDAVDTHLGIYDVSYLWLGMIGFMLSIFFGMIISLATGMNKTRKLGESLIFPCCRSFWRVQFSESYPPAFHGQLVSKEKQEYSGMSWHPRTYALVFFQTFANSKPYMISIFIDGFCLFVFFIILMKLVGGEVVDTNVVHPPPWNRSWYLELPVDEPQPITK